MDREATKMDESSVVKVFDTPSGVRAYQKGIPNRSHMGEFLTDKARWVKVSLPYLSIMRHPA